MSGGLKLDVLVSCMWQKDLSIVAKSHITGGAVVVNQCDSEGFSVLPTRDGMAKMYSVSQRGLTKSRNMAIGLSKADICVLCDDDEVFEDDYRQKIHTAYTKLSDADVIIFKMKNRTPSFPDKVRRLRFPATMKVSSWQISFRKQSLVRAGVSFDEKLGAGSGNGAEEELKFLLDCERAGLKIYYVPSVIASVGQQSSTWFSGFNEKFFRDRGNTTRYILGLPVSVLYAVYYLVRKRDMYAKDISFGRAAKALFKGIAENKIGGAANNKNQAVQHGGNSFQ